MKKRNVTNLQLLGTRVLGKDELRTLNGGREVIMHDCETGIHCTCNGSHSCVSTVQECWDKC